MPTIDPAMPVHTNDPVIGVDGGGSRCRLALRQGADLVQVTLGPCNLSTDFESGIKALRSGLEALSARVGLPLEAVPHAGTGSFVAVQSGRVARFAGGWGVILGDEGSGYWVGRAALRARLAGSEGRAPMGPLARDIAARIGDAPAVIGFAQRASAADIAALAQVVVAHADQDPVAQDILVRAGRYLTEIAREIGMEDQGPICMTGGLGPSLGSYLDAAYRSRLVPPKASPLDGALDLAAEIPVTT